MLKKCFQKWDIERKLKEADILFAVRIAREREAQGKKTDFLIRGRTVTLRMSRSISSAKGLMI